MTTNRASITWTPAFLKYLWWPEATPFTLAWGHAVNSTSPPVVFLFLQVAGEIRHLLKDYTKTIPTVLEIPSKDSP